MLLDGQRVEWLESNRRHQASDPICTLELVFSREPLPGTHTRANVHVRDVFLNASEQTIFWVLVSVWLKLAAICFLFKLILFRCDLYSRKCTCYGVLSNENMLFSLLSSQHTACFLFLSLGVLVYSHSHRHAQPQATTLLPSVTMDG